ncbi:hypothetical protein FQA47_017000 [Oryzias melastigma]|uniref:Uncharacterized protein n=1 Tax=Oryzias melastigma TaxID=30732 RepID=A0A834F5X3_ORYME|nr:hypothetical protein FQA47_017000 [Oryzias melastigma]
MFVTCPGGVDVHARSILGSPETFLHRAEPSYTKERHAANTDRAVSSSLSSSCLTCLNSSSSSCFRTAEAFRRVDQSYRLPFQFEHVVFGLRVEVIESVTPVCHATEDKQANHRLYHCTGL